MSSTPPRRSNFRADQRGITLQTLIVTAVLVLVAGAASAILLAINSNSSDDLEAQNVDTPSNCKPWEIHDSTLDAKGFGGPTGLGGFYSSAIGCQRVCYAQIDGHTQPTFSSRIGRTNANRFIHRGITVKQWNAPYLVLLGLSREDVRLAPAKGEATHLRATYQVVSSTQVGEVPSWDTVGNARRTSFKNDDALTAPEGLLTVVDEGEEIRVHPSGRYCQLLDADGEEIIRSDYETPWGNSFNYDQ